MIFKKYTQLPVSVTTTSWTKTSIDEAIAGHEGGNFKGSSELMDAMMRDDAIAGIMDVRVKGLLGLPKKIEAPANTGEVGSKVVGFIDKHQDKFFPKGILTELMASAVFLGFGFAQIVWEPLTKDVWGPTFEYWHPQFISYHEHDRTWRAQTLEGQVDVNLHSGQWLCVKDGERSFMRGLIRSLGNLYLSRQHSFRDWDRWGELYSLGIKKAIVPSMADPAKKRRYAAQLKAMGGEGTILVERDDNAQSAKWDVEIEHPDSGSASSGFDQKLTSMSSRIAIRVLGQNLTTEVSGGSYAAATVHAAVKASILSDDALMLSQCLRNDVLKPWAKFNLSAGSGVAPIVSLDTDPPEQKNEKAQALKATAEALVASAGALDAMMKLGLKVDLARFAKEQELPLSSNEITPPPVPQLPEPTPQPPTPTHVLSLAQPLGIEGEIEQALTIQQELDGVAEDASKLGAQSFDGLLSALNSVVQDIDDEAELQVETLKAKLLDVYGQFDESEFERIMEASLILSDGLGDSSVLAQPTIEEKEGEP